MRKNEGDEVEAAFSKWAMNFIRVDAGERFLAKLAGEKEAGSAAGSIDMIWINGENFYSAKENGLLYGAFLDKLPNTGNYIDTEDPETLNDFCMPIEGYEAPYGRAQMVLYNDSAVTPETPPAAQELLVYCQQYPGKVTYPALPDFTGSAFVRNIIYELCGWEHSRPWRRTTRP